MPGRGGSNARTSEVSCIWYSLLLAACWIKPPALATAGGLKLSRGTEHGEQIFASKKSGILWECAVGRTSHREILCRWLRAVAVCLTSRAIAADHAPSQIRPHGEIVCSRWKLPHQTLCRRHRFQRQRRAQIKRARVVGYRP